MTAIDPVPAAVRPLRPIVPLLTRLVVAQVFLTAGIGKWTDYSKAVDGFRSLGLPAPDVLTGVVASVEVLGAVLILLGLFTRVGALLLSGVMVVALATAHLSEVRESLVLQPETGKGLTTIAAFVMLALLSWLLVFGPGAISIDRLRAWRRRRNDARSGSVGESRGERGLRRHERRIPAHRESLERAKVEPGRARAEREQAVPSRLLGHRPAGEVRGETPPPEVRGPMSGRTPPEEPPEIDAPGRPRL